MNAAQKKLDEAAASLSRAAYIFALVGFAATSVLGSSFVGLTWESFSLPRLVGYVLVLAPFVRATFVAWRGKSQKVHGASIVFGFYATLWMAVLGALLVARLMV